MSAPAMAEFMSSTGLVHATEPGGPKRASLVVNDSKVVSMDAKNDVYGSRSQRISRYSCPIAVLTITLISCSRSSHNCTTSITALRWTSGFGVPPLTAAWNAASCACFLRFSRLVLDMGSPPAYMRGVVSQIRGNGAGKCLTHIAGLHRS